MPTSLARLAPGPEECDWSPRLERTFMPRKCRSDVEDCGFGALLKTIRLRERLALATFAQRLGMTAANLCDLEQGRKVPGPQRAIAIARQLGLAEELLLSLALENQLARKNIHCRVSVKLRQPSKDIQHKAGVSHA